MERIGRKIIQIKTPLFNIFQYFNNKIISKYVLYYLSILGYPNIKSSNSNNKLEIYVLKISNVYIIFKATASN